jgi:hypothetical protein
VIHYRASGKLHRELLIALESARTHLAVAIATEAKSTTPVRLRSYLETAERARRFMKKLRTMNSEMPQEREVWGCALEKLRCFPLKGNAAGLCELLGDIVAQLE